MKRRRSIPVFSFVLTILLATAILWLVLGLLPAIAAASGSFHARLHEWGAGSGVFAEMAQKIAQASHAAGSGPQVFFDYLFSIFNIGLGLLLLKLHPRDPTARLLSIGMIGTAVAFNLQGHDALQVIPFASLGPVDGWHVLLHLASGLCYIFALLMFPDGTLGIGGARASIWRAPLLVLLAFFFALASLVTVDDHTLGLVIVFGLFIPVAGLTAQARRFRRARDLERRQQSKVLLAALAVSLLVALPLVFLTTSPGGEDASETKSYEIEASQPGLYFFRCDPHPEEMKGIARVVEGGAGRNIDISSVESEFSKDEFTLTAGRINEMSFTNFDSDLHNVAIYKDAPGLDPIFIGQEFSGQDTAVVAFRGFRAIFALIPIALFVGLVRFRLWDIDRVINRTLVYGLLAGVITIIYLAAVVGIGTLVGANDRLNLVLSIVVTALLAMAFQPLRNRAQKLINRLVYGKRATPYEVLTEFSVRAGDAYDVVEVLPQLARTIAEGTGALRSEVWLRVGSRIHRAATWPPDDGGDVTSLPMTGEELPPLPEVQKVMPVRHRGEILGALAIAYKGQGPTPIEERLLDGVASQAGLVLRNVQLTTELQARLGDLRASRQRIAVAQDEERRRLERDIHDGAQQQLIALVMRLGLAKDLTVDDPSKARDLLDELQSETAGALATLRDLARGIYPPVLADKGLVQALGAHARRCPVPVQVTSAAVERYEPEIEAAVYFCCLEAIQNTIKHAPAASVTVSLVGAEGNLDVLIRDDGEGFDVQGRAEGSGLQNMRDRIAAVGGELRIESSAGHGTTIVGSIPVGLRRAGPRFRKVEPTPLGPSVREKY
ncbi:MAG: hypothetical protein QOH26_1915 [Actinomycetota bacterium]|nr:hypothetical protein [Actinomycetota bacterium]